MNNIQFECFFTAVKEGNCEIVRDLIKEGFNINVSGRFGNVLQENLTTRSLGTIKLLLQNGINVNEVSVPFGLTPLYRAVVSNEQIICKLFLKYGADPDFYVNGYTPLHYSIRRDTRYYKIPKALIKRTKNINIKDEDGRTALHRAALFNQYAIVSTIIRKKASPVIRDKKGRTPLQLIQFGIDKHESFERYESFRVVDNTPRDEDYTDVIGLLTKYENYYRRITLVLCAREFDADSLFYIDYLPFDVFKLIFKEIGSFFKPTEIKKF